MDSYEGYDASPGRNRDMDSFPGRGAPAEYRRRSPGMLLHDWCLTGGRRATSYIDQRFQLLKIAVAVVVAVPGLP
jgi:hypothetical protein